MPQRKYSLQLKISEKFFIIRGRVLSTHAAGRGEGVLKLRANACMGGGGVQPMSTHLNPYMCIF